MKTPFTLEQFLEVFKNYNTAVWPMQIIFYLLGGIAIFLVFKKIQSGDKIICLILSILWIWIGGVYHLLFFTTINKAAYAFGILFILQGILFIIFGVIKPLLSFQFNIDRNGLFGIAFLTYSVLVYPILGYLLGHRYPYSPTFGLPCPSVIFTFGILLFTNKKMPFFLMIIPLIWSIIGFFAAISFGILEDIGLLITGILGTALLLIKNKTYSSITPVV